MLSKKPIVLIFTIVNLALLAQLFPSPNYSSLGNKISNPQINKVDLIQSNIDLIDLQSNPVSEYFSRLFANKKLPTNKAKEYMKIKFRQSGGYAGLRMGLDLDTNLLSTDEATRLESLVQTSGILQSKSGHAKNAADLINYEMTIENQDGTHQLNFDDLTLPESVIPLLDYLQSQAKPIVNGK